MFRKPCCNFWTLAATNFWTLVATNFLTLAATYFWTLAATNFLTLAATNFWTLAATNFWTLAATIFWTLVATVLISGLWQLLIITSRLNKLNSLTAPQTTVSNVNNGYVHAHLSTQLFDLNPCLTPYSLVVGFFVVCRDKNPYLIKGSVSRDFRPLFLSNDSNPSGPLMNRVNYFRIRFRFHRDILSQSSTNSTLRCALQILGLVKPLFKTSNLFFHDRCVHP